MRATLTARHGRAANGTRRLAVIAACGLIVWSAQAAAESHSRYSVKDIGSLGGGNAVPNWLTESGDIIGYSNTGTGFSSGFPLQHAFRWHDGRMIDLGTPNGNFTYGFGGNDRGQVAGQTFLPDDFTGHAALWSRAGVLTDLGTLGGTNSYANAINNKGKVVGVSESSVLDPLSMAQEQRPFVWEDGLMTDLGTLGGASGFATDINDAGVIVGGSAVDFTVTPPATSPRFFAEYWQDGVATKLEASGAVESFALRINRRSDLAGEYSAVDSSGIEITHACLWTKDDEHGGGYGPARDLGALPGNPHSQSYGINNRGQIVGAVGPFFVEAFVSAVAFIWRNGTMTDLNTLIPADTGLQLVAAVGINDRGEIAVQAIDGSGSSHALLLTPTDD